MNVAFKSSVEGEHALLGQHVVAVLHKPTRAGGDWWCTLPGTGGVHKGLTQAAARDLVVRILRAREDQRQRDKTPTRRRERAVDASAMSTPPAPKPRPATSTAPVSAVVPTRAPGREMTLCPLCGTWLSKVEKHFRKVHPDRMDLVASLTGPSPASASAVGAGARLRKVKPVPKVPPKHLTIPLLREGPSRVVRCPVCRMSVQPVAIWEHIGRLHPSADYAHWQVEGEAKRGRSGQTGATPRAGNKNASPQAQDASKPGPKRGRQDWLKRIATAITRANAGASGSKPLGRAPLDARRKTFRSTDRADPAVRHERTNDATRLYAERYREWGRFGSHSVHDAYSDEDPA